MIIKNLIEIISSDEQIICIQDTSENVLYLGEKVELETDYSQYLSRGILDVYSERYKSLNGISGITITVEERSNT